MFSHKSLMLLLAISLCCFVSCEKEESNSFSATEEGELYFGTYYGECAGECATIYWLLGNELREDTIDYFYNAELSLGVTEAYSLLPEDDFTITNGLLELFPNELFDLPESIGAPDSYDQGGYFIAVPSEDDGSYREWRISTNLNDVPESLHPFLEAVADRMQLLSE